MVNRYPVKKYPMVGVCGLDCGLCSRFHTDGKSKCPGCCGPDFFERHPSCGFVTCAVKQRGLESCAQCPDWHDCEKVYQLLQAAQLRDSFLSYKTVPDNLSFMKQNGVAAFAVELETKQQVLLKLLHNFDDGRAKLFYCIACQLLPIADLDKTIKTAEKNLKPSDDIKDKAKLMRNAISRLAEILHVDLQLRNK